MFSARSIYYKRYLLNCILFLVFVLLIFSERKVIEYTFFGQRNISITDVLFIIFVPVYIGYQIYRTHIADLKVPVQVIGITLIPMGVLVFLFFSCSNRPEDLFRAICGPDFPIRVYLLIGLSAFMALSSFALIKFNEKEIVKLVFWYTLGMSAFFFVHYLLVNERIFNFTYLFYGEGTPFLHLPFLSPVQAGLFGVIILLLGVGTTLVYGRLYLLYFLVPAMTLAIAQTGSRSVMLVYVYSWLGFMFLVFINRRLYRGQVKRYAKHFTLVTVIASLLLFVLPGFSNKRAIEFFSESPISLLRGSPDKSFRGPLWALSLSELRKIVLEGKDKAGIETKAIDVSLKGEVGNLKNIALHNAYLDFLVYGGVSALVTFIIFLGLLCIQLGLLVWRKRKSEYYPLYTAIFMALMAIIVEFYANTILQIRYIWVFFGLVLALVIIDEHSNIRKKTIIEKR